MNIEALISHLTPPLRPDDTVEQALGLLMEVHVRHLPVVDEDGMLTGLVSENALLDADGPGASIRSLPGSRPVSVRPGSHVFDVTRKMVQHDLTTLPVAHADGRYLGLVRRHDIFERFALMLCTHEPGAILALEIDQRDYALSQLTYTIEQNGVKILSISTEPPSEPSDTKVRVTLKLNVHDTSRVRYLLEHHGYQVVAAFGEEEDDEDLLYRIQEFMRYLEV